MDDDVVVQKDHIGLWLINLKENTNGVLKLMQKATIVLIITDDMLSLHNFYVIFIAVGVHKATYAERKARKLKKIAKKEIVT